MRYWFKSHLTKLLKCSPNIFKSELFPFTSKKVSREPEIPRAQLESHDEKSLELSYFDIRHLPIDVWQQFSNLIELWSCTAAPCCPPSQPLFFYTKIHESLVSGVTEGWKEVLWLPSHQLKSPQLNISEWRDHSPKVIYNRATESEIDGWDFQLCAWEMFPAICSNVLYFSSRFLVPYVSQQGRGKWRHVSYIYPLRFYGQL